VNIIDKPQSGRRRRRIFDPAFKAEVVATCQHPGVSVAAIALDHGLNANLLRRWITEHERYGHHGSEGTSELVHEKQAQTSRPSVQPLPAAFVPVSVAPAPAQGEVIRLAITRGGATIRVQWPMSGAAQCTELLREWLR